MSQFTVILPVRWGDMDAFGHVSNAVFLRYLEEVRAQWMSSVPSYWQGKEAGPVVANININYRQPLHWPEQLCVTLLPQSPGRSSIKLSQEVRAAEPDENGQKTIYADATCTLVWIDKRTGEPVPLPGVMRDLAG